MEEDKRFWNPGLGMREISLAGYCAVGMAVGYVGEMIYPNDGYEPELLIGAVLTGMIPQLDKVIARKDESLSYLESAVLGGGFVVGSLLRKIG